jgi:hypothetical protein
MTDSMAFSTYVPSVFLLYFFATASDLWSFLDYYRTVPEKVRILRLSPIPLHLSTRDKPKQAAPSRPQSPPSPRLIPVHSYLPITHLIFDHVHDMRGRPE